jgi:tellurite resistance protein
MFAQLKQRLSGAMNKVAGNKDFLEGVCAACALVAAADGTVDDSEIQIAVANVTGNATLNGSFTKQEIAMTMESMLKRTGTRTGKLGLYTEIGEATAKIGAGEVIYLAALDVAEADGTIDDEEQAVLTKIAERCGVDRGALEA